jgi:hypothetical protein
MNFPLAALIPGPSFHGGGHTVNCRPVDVAVHNGPNFVDAG